MRTNILIICLQGLTLFFILQNKTQHVYSPGDQLFERNKTDHILFCNCVIILYTLHVFRTIQIYIKKHWFKLTLYMCIVISFFKWKWMWDMWNKVKGVTYNSRWTTLWLVSLIVNPKWHVYNVHIISLEFYNLIIHNFITKTVFLHILWFRCSLNKTEMITRCKTMGV